MRKVSRMRCTLLGIFFFQAEDGIRYRTVTGVQTCALPISSSWRCPENCVLCRRMPGAVWFYLRQLDVWSFFPGSLWCTLEEIGRASCRERVQVRGGAGGLKEEVRTRRGRKRGLKKMIVSRR